MEEQNFKDDDSLEYSFAKVVWEFRQAEIDELKSITDLIFNRCDKTLQYWEDYDELRARINKRV